MATKATSEYKWSKGTKFKGLEAQRVGECLEAMRVANDGQLTPKAVVSAASDSASLIHAVFEWDDTVAAEAHRIWQARQLIGRLEVTYIDRPTMGPLRAFANVTINKAQYYESMRVAVDDPAKRQQILADAMREINSWRRRYAAIEELAGIRQAIADVRLTQSVEDKRPDGLARVKIG